MLALKDFIDEAEEFTEELNRSIFEASRMTFPSFA